MTYILDEGFDDLDGLFDLGNRDQTVEDRPYGLDDDIETELEDLRVQRQNRRCKAAIQKRLGLDI